MRVEVNRIDVLRQQREPAVVHRQHSPAERMLVDVTDFEVFVDSPGPTSLNSQLPTPTSQRHSFRDSLLFRCCRTIHQPFPMNRPLSGKRALVTGSTRGLGLATV